MRNNKLSHKRVLYNSLTRVATALCLLLATSGAALAAPVVHTSGPNFGAASVGWNEYQLTATGGDGVNYAWSLVPGFGTLPPGMAIRTDTPSWFDPSARAGLIGVATTPGTYQFRLRVTSGVEVADQDYTFTISSLVVKDPYQVFDAYVGEVYSYKLTAQRNGVDVSASWQTTTFGNYPPGVTLSASGVLQGTPTAAGAYDFGYSVTEGGQTVYKGGHIVVNLVHVTTNALSNAVQGASYSASIAATGGSGNYTFSITSANLPFGLVLNSSGTISGTVNSGPGVYPFQVTATDTVNHSSVSKWLSIDVIGVPPTLASIVPYYNAFWQPAVGQAFSLGVQVRNGGRAPFSWSVTGLPQGVSYRFGTDANSTLYAPGDLEIWGNATVAGDYNVVVTVTDADNVSTTNAFPLHVSRLFLSTYPNNATFGAAYSATLRFVGGTPPYTAVQIDGRLPLNVGFDGATQILSGTPGETGNFFAEFRSTDRDGNIIDNWIALFVDGPSIQINSNDNLGTTSTNAPYSNQLFGCCAAVITWSVVDPSTLPPGMTLSASGVLSGTPTAPGTYTFVVKATADGSATNYALRQFTLIVTPVQVTTNFTLPFGNVGSPYGGASGFQLNVTGGTTPYSWTLVPSSGSYLPPNMALSQSGVLSGTPTSTGQYLFSVKVTDAANRVRYANFSLSIYPAGGVPPPGFNNGTNFGTWSIGQVDGVQLIGKGGNGTYTFSFEGGTLPPGLAIRTDVPSFFPAGSSGLIGVATTPGTYAFQLGVTSAGVKTVQSFTMKIVNLVVKNLYSQLNTYVGQSFSYQLIALRDGVQVPATWTATGPLPAGVSLSSSGELSGKPAAPGFQNISFNYSDGVDTTFRSVNYTAFALQITTSGDVLPNAISGAAYSTPVLTTTGGSGSYTYSATGNFGGLTFNSSTGVLSGNITNSPGTFSYTITATDTMTGAQSDGKRFTVTVLGSVATPPQVTNFGNVVSDGTVGVPFSRTINVTNGGSAPFTWAAEGLPPGMEIRWGSGVASSNVNPTQVELWGTPVAGGLFNVKLTVTDALNVSASQTFPLFISELMTTTGLANGTIETPYSQTLRVIGGTPGYTAVQTGGILANGLSLNAATQTVSGTPHESGGMNVVLQFTDSASRTFQSSFFYNINSVLGKININTGSDLGSTTTGSAFSRQLSASISACCASGLTWTVTDGALPNGMNLSTGGLLSGTPTTSGVFTFVIRATDSGNTAWFAARQFTLNVSPLVLSTNTSLPFGNVAAPYSTALVLTGGTGSISWAIAPFNYLPPGLSLVATSGGGTAIAGVPKVPGSFAFTLIASDTGGHTLSRSFTLSIYPAGGYPPLNWTGFGPNFGPVGLGVVTNIQLTGVSGGVPPYHYSYKSDATPIPGMRVQDGQPLPTFFPLSVGGGVIGVVTTSGVYASTVRVTDSVGNTVDRPIVLTVSPLHILSQPTLPKATRNVAYNFTMEPFPSGGSYTWSATNMPAGVTIDAATGIISGTPTTAGQFNAIITLRDSASNSVGLTYTIIVNPYAITTNGVLPNATQNSAYNQGLSAPGCTPCSWSVQGALPQGLSLNASTGVISGTPTAATFTSFGIVATSGGNNVSKLFSLRVVATAPQPLAILNNASLGYQTIGNNVSFGLSVIGGTGPYTWSLLSGALPTGVRIDGPGDAFGGNLVAGFTYLLGRALQLGTFNFTLKVTDSTGAFVTKAFTYTITPLAHSYFTLPVTFTNPVNTIVTPLVYQAAYSQPLLVLGGSGSYTYTALTALPTGLVLDSLTGIVSGTPIVTGSFNVSVQATDTAGNVVVSNITFNIAGPTGTLLNFGSGPGLGITQLGTGNGFNNNLSVTGGTGSYTLTALTPLPPGFGLEFGNSIIGNNGVGTSVLSGTPLAPGAYTFTIEARDTAGNVGARTFTLNVAPFTLASNTGLPDASLGVPYSQTLLTWDNVSTPTWTAASPLPPGLSVSGNVISGTPTAAGTFNFSLTLSDATGASINFTNFSLRVSNMSITDPQVLPVTVTPNVPFTYTFTAVGGGGTKTWSPQSLPAGFSLSSGGTLTGTTANIAGTFNVTLTVNDGLVALQKRFTLYVRATNPAQLDFPMFSTVLPDASINQSYVNSPLPSGGTPPYSFSVAPGSTLPPGLSLISASDIGLPVPPAFFPGGVVLAGAPGTEGQYAFDLVISDSVGASVRRTFTLNVSSINILPGAPRTAITGTAYAEQFTGVGGTGPYTFTTSQQSLVQDMLPPGFTLSPSGLVSGSTNSTGNYAFVLRVQDSAGHSFSRTYVGGTQLTVNNALGFRVTNTNNFDVKLGQGLFETQLMTSGNSSYTWSVAPNSSLPPGLFLLSGQPFLGNGQTELSGQPTTAGTFTYTLRATDNANPANVMDHTFTINVVPMHLVSPPLRFMGVFQLPSVEVGTPYTFTFKSAGGAPPYTYVVSPFTPLPAGLSLSSDGVLSGWPASPGSYALGLNITDAAGNVLHVPGGFTLVVTPAGVAPPLFLNNLNLDVNTASVAVPFNVALDTYVRGGRAPFTFALAAGSALPPGLRLLAGGNGVPNSIGGAATTAGEFQYFLTVTDAAGQTATGKVGQHVSPMSATPVKLPPGKVGTPYSAKFNPLGGMGTYTILPAPMFDLPAGLTLDATGLLSGIPTTAGDYVFVLVVFDGVDYLAQMHRMTIDDDGGEAPAVTLPDAFVVNYVQGAAGGASIPLTVSSTSGTQPFTSLATGIQGASTSPASGIATGIVNLNLDAAALTTGTYVGAVGVSAPASANANDFSPLVLNVVPLGADTVPPSIAGVPGDIVVEATSPAGAVVNFSTPTATDNFYPAPTLTVSPPPGSAFPVGVNTVTITATDATGNTTVRTFTVTVRDTIKPTVVIDTPLSGVVYGVGQFVLPSFSCGDLVRVVSCVGPSPEGVALDTSRPGMFTFTVTATDEAGNTSSASTTYSVVADTPATTVDFEVLHSFGGQDGSSPLAGLVRGSDGNFYGTTYIGGANGYGSVFKIDALGTVTTLHSFDNVNDGAYPYAGLVQGRDGAFYGVAYYGGPTGNGTIFKVDPNGSFVVLHALSTSEGTTALFSLVQGEDGSFYGTAVGGGATGYGTIFKITPAGSFTVLHQFNYADGGNPRGALISGGDGFFYGTTSSGGSIGYGTFFKLDPSGDVITLHSFTSADGVSPQAGVVRGGDGNFYGTTVSGGQYGYGTVFKLTPNGTLTTLYSFASGDGSYSYGNLVVGRDGALYGQTYQGGPNNYGTTFRIDTAGVLTMLHAFSGFDGAYPYAGLIQDTDGRLYGTTYGGGTSGGGTVFRITLNLGAATTASLVAQNSAATFGGYAPVSATLTSSGPVAGRTINFTLNGSPIGAAVTNMSGVATLPNVNVASFPAGSYPTAIRASYAGDVLFKAITSAEAALVVSKATPSVYWYTPAPIVEGTALDVTQLNAYASTAGTFTYTPPAGTVLSIGTGQMLSVHFTPTDTANYVDTTATVNIDVVSVSDVPDTFQVLHSFNYPDDGAYLYGPLTRGDDGNFYGVTYYGGPSGAGTVFKIDPSGALTTLHAFDYSTEGGYSQSGLSRGSDGYFYGTTFSGGPNGVGTAFKINPAGELTVIHAFSYAEGLYTYGGIIRGRDGNVYGAANYYGPTGYGTVFKIDATTGALTVLRAFDYTNDGAYPYGGLVQGDDDNFYGTTYYGGSLGYGTVFKVDANGNFSTVHFFDPSKEGGYPNGTLIQGHDGNIYGTTYLFGPMGYGTAFKMSKSGALTVLHSFDYYTTGGYLYAGLTEGPDGTFYGVTTRGTPIGFGTIFKLDPTGALSTLHVFRASEGTDHRGALVRGADGGLYGTAIQAGTFNYGLAFRLTITPATMVVSSASGLYGDATTLSATLTSAGTPVSSRQVTFRLNGVAVGSGVTDSTGIATLANVSLAGINAGAHTGVVQASFAGDRSYPAAAGSADLSVARRATHVTWSTPADIISSTPLESGQLTARADVPGTFVYSPPAGTLLPIGAGQPLSVDFTPADTTNYVPSAAQTHISVIDSSLAVCVSSPGGLISWWSGEGNGLDRMGVNPAALQGGVTFSSGRIGQGFTFAAPGRVVVSPSPNLNLTALTLEAWISFDVLPSGFGAIATKQNSSYINYSLFLTSTGELAFYWVDPAGTHSVVSSGVAMAPRIFHHVAATADGARVRFYVDGVLMSDAPQPSPLVPVPDGALSIGSQPSTDQFYGVIDEVAIYDHALTSDELRGIYLAGVIGKCRPPSVLNVSASIAPLGGTTDLRAVLTSNAVPLANQTVTFVLNGVTVGSATTDGAGVARQPGVSVAGLAAGTYPTAVAARFDGDAMYGPVEQSASLTVVDTAGPGVSVLTPADGAVYVIGTPVAASYTCIDPSGVTSCVGPVPNGQAIDTSTSGPHNFTVTAADVFRNGSVASVTYTVIELPRIDVAAPGDPIYELGSVVLARYSCVNSVTCQGDVATGTPIDTSTPGPKSFTITATDAYGNATTRVVTYTVSLGVCVSPFVGMTAWLSGDGTPADELGGNSAWVGTAAYESGRVAQAFSFGSGSYVTLPIVQHGSFTLQGWVRTTNGTLPAGTGVISTGASGQEAVSAQVELDGAGNYQVQIGAGDLVLFIGPATTSFQHVAVTYDQATGIVSTYLNGQVADFNYWTGSPDLVQVLRLGVNRQGTGARFAGALDELQLFSRALTDAEILTTFQAGASGLCKVAPPTAVIVGDSALEATGAAGALAHLDGSASSDPDGGPLTYAWTEGATVLGTTSTLSIVLPIGSHVITLAVDGRHKQGSAKVTVVVRDTTPPTITGTPASFALEASGAAGAVASYASASATDVVDGSVDVVCLPASGATFALGKTTVNCTATDAHLNAAHTSFEVSVSDTTPAVLAGVPAGFTIEATGASGAVVTWPSPTAADVVDGNVGVVCAPASGSAFAIGTTHVACSAVDAHGNAVAAGFDVVVRDTTPPLISGVPPTVIAEATSGAGALVTWTAPTAFDVVDGAVPVICSATPNTQFALGDSVVSCTASDSRSNRSDARFTVRVADTVGPSLSLPVSVVAEATGPLGAAVPYVASATDVVSGAIAISCAPASGSTFGVGLTAVTCSASDAAGNVTAAEFPVVVRDTAAPAAQFVTPSPDALPAASPMAVTVQVTDLVGVSSVAVNGTPASLTSGTPQSGTWTASVPVALAAGAAIELRAVSTDASGNGSEVVRVVDNDGIQSQAPPAALAPFALDRGRTSGADLSSTYSSEFNNGITTGSITRNGWTATFTASTAPPRPLTVPPTAFWPTTGWVQVAISGASPADAIVSACVGGIKQIRLNAAGERGVFACDPVTGTIAFKALSASPTIEVWKQLTATAWLAIPVMTGGGISTGSPTTAFPDNPGPIEVKVVRYDDGGVPHVVGTFQLAPGASADVLVNADAAGGDDQFVFKALLGRVPVVMGNVLRTLEPGTAATVPVDRTPPTIAVNAPRADAVYVLRQSVAASFSCGDGASAVATCEGSSVDGGPLSTSSVGAATFSVVAADRMGNSRSVSVPFAVTYAVELDGRTISTDGETLSLAVRIADALGANQSSESIPVRATGILSGDGATRLDLDDQLRFDTASNTYRLDVKATGLRVGDYRLQLEVSGDPVPHVVPFPLP